MPLKINLSFFSPLKKRSYKSMYSTEQQEFWKGEFGRQYTDRNTREHEAWNDFYRNLYGKTKIQLNTEFIGHLPLDSPILEVGCNTGQQLEALQRQGFTQLYGVELQWYAVEKAKSLLQNINIIQGSGFDLPFKDRFFQVVCTNGVLIHIAPDDLPKIMGEMYRCSARYIMGFEYYAPQTTAINYRGNEGFLWKANYAQLFLDRFPDLRLVKTEMLPYLTETEKGNIDQMYLLEKTT